MNLIHRIKFQKRYLRVFRESIKPWAPAERITVVSPGGVATTTLMLHISRFARLNSHADADGLKHRPKPPETLHDGQRLLFLYGPLNKSIASLERRDWLRIQKIRYQVGQSKAPQALSYLAVLLYHAAQVAGHSGS